MPTLQGKRYFLNSEEKELMECPFCQGKMQWKTAPFSIECNGYHMTWNAIPAWVCENCGEVVFEAKEVDLIQTAFFLND